MSLVDQNRRSSGRKTILHANRVWHSNGHVVKARATGKTNLLRASGAIVSVRHHAVASHRAAKQFDGGTLLGKGKMCYPCGLRDLLEDSTAYRIRRLP